MSFQHGISIAGNDDWSTACMHYDLARMFRDWGHPGTPWDGLDGGAADIPRTADNHPKADVGSYFFTNGYPAGDYTWSFKGSGVLSWFGGTLVSVAQSGKSGVVRLAGCGAPASFSVTKVDPTDPPHDFHLYVPGYLPSWGQWAKPYLDFLRPFSVLRLMDIMGTNQSKVVRWSDRTPPSATIQTRQQYGMAYEYLIALANWLGKSVWVNVPYQADDDCLANLAALFSSLNPDLKVYVEWGNEIWNSAFPVHAWAYDLINNPDKTPKPYASQLGLTNADDNGRLMEYVAWQLKRCVVAFRQAFRDPSRVRGIYASQAQNNWLCSQGLAWPGWKPKDYVWSLAYADYFCDNSYPQGNPTWQDPPVSVDEIFVRANKLLTDGSSWSSLGYAKKYRKLADDYGVPYVSCYEAGQGLTGKNYVPLMAAAQDDERMYALYQAAPRQAKANGVDGVYNWFTSISTYGDNTNGFWGLSPSVNRGSQKWKAVYDLMGAHAPLQPGETNTPTVLGPQSPSVSVVTNPDGSITVIVPPSATVRTYGAARVDVGLPTP